MKLIEDIKQTTSMMWGTEQKLRELANKLDNVWDYEYYRLPQEKVKELHDQLKRLVNKDIPSFITECLLQQRMILSQTNRIYDFIDWRDEDGNQ